MKIAVFGYKGFIGSKIFQILTNAGYLITGIDRDNYKGLVGSHFDYFINSAGNSLKWKANIEPRFDFNKTVKDTYKTLFDFYIDNYILISSIDSYKSSENKYGFHKRLIQEIMIKYFKKKGKGSLTILNCGSVIGKNMKKGVLFDLLNNNPIRLSLESKLQFITNTEVANVVLNIIQQNLVGGTINVISSDKISIKDICKILNINPKIIGNELQIYDYVCDINKVKIQPKPCEYYIKEVLNERME